MADVIDRSVKDDVVVFGKTTLTEAEYATLHMLGYVLHTLGRRLHTTKAAGTAAAVSEGYTLAGGTPNYHTRGIGNLDGQIVAVTDNEIAQQLNRRLSFDWRNDPRWFVLDDEATILTTGQLMLGVLAETDRLHLVTDSAPAEGGG